MRASTLLTCLLPMACALLVGACGRDSPGAGMDASTRDVSARPEAGSDVTLGNKPDAHEKSHCVSGQSCGDGGVCAGETCCAAALACGSTCCGSGSLCSFNKCVKPGAACMDTSECATNEYCQYSLKTGESSVDGGKESGGGKDAMSSEAGACVGGAVLPSGVCLPSPPICPGDAGAPDGGGCIERCEYHPPAGAFTPTLAYAWGGEITAPFATDVMMAPIVLPLEDTNCDGTVNGEDIPDIVFSSFSNGAYTESGTLHAIAVRNGQLVDRWSVPAAQVDPIASLAGGNIDGKPGNEIVACLQYAVTGGSAVGVRAFGADGSILWTTLGGSCFMPALADLDGDGSVEVVTEGGIFDGATGTLKASWDGTAGTAIGNFAISDLDGDGELDIITSVGAYHADGTRFVTADPVTTYPETISSYVAVGDLEKDGHPEVVATSFATHTVSVWHYDSTQPGGLVWLRQGIDINGVQPAHCAAGSAGATEGGGPPTIADFNGDGVPDIALAGGIGYAILDGSKVIDSAVPDTMLFLWTSPTTDCSSAETGSSVFDFTGDGKAEALYSDEERLRVYDGPTGTVLWSTCNTTGTVVEYPLVVDVDNDGHADIVVVSNAYASPYGAEYQCADVDAGPIAQSGVRVFSDPDLRWVRTRALWNQHTYHVTNVNDDGTIPQHELPNWKQAGLNDFRQNKQPGSEFAAPDAVVSVVPACSSPFSVTVDVRNIGEAALPAGVLVELYAGLPSAGKKLASKVTPLPLYSAQSVALTFTDIPATDQAGSFSAWVDPPSAPPHPSFHECNTANNMAIPAVTVCGGGPK